MSSVLLHAWLRTALLALVTALLLDHLVTTTPASYAATPSVPAAGATTQAEASERGQDPRRTRRLFVDRLMPAAVASRSDRGFRPIGKRPQALWITDHYAKKKVRTAVRTGTERRYAVRVNRRLRQLGIRGKHFVIETARNGAGEAPDPRVCNPPHARIGRKPRLVFAGALDGYLWIKHPGESDGPCNGGPAAGEWWPEGALQLLGD